MRFAPTLVVLTALLFATAHAQFDAAEAAAPAMSRADLGLAPLEKGERGTSLTAPFWPMSVTGSQAYAADILNHAWVRFNTAAPETVDILQSTPTSLYAGDFDGQGRFYAIDNVTWEYGVVDTTTGQLTPVGVVSPTSGHTWTGMSFDPTTGTMFAVSSDVSSSTLYALDPGSGTANAIATTGDAPAIIAIAFDASGQLYGHDIVLDATFTIDKVTGAIGTPRPTGFDANFLQAMDADPVTGQIYMAAFNNSAFGPELRLLDPQTGGTTLIGVIGDATLLTQVAAFGLSTGFGDAGDPRPPVDLVAFSDFNTPTEMSLTWSDPVRRVDGTPISAADFRIDIFRDGAFVDSVDGGVQAYSDAGLTDGRSYTYEAVARLIATDSTSIAATARWTAGGAGAPLAPTDVVVVMTAGGDLEVRWRNPSRNIDGTAMDDFAGVRLFENGAPIATFTRSSADTGSADSEVFTPAPGTNRYVLTAIDNESPANESEPSAPAFSPIAVPFFDDFPTAGDPNSGFWLNGGADVNDRALNPVSGPFALNLNGAPSGGDTITLRPVDLSGAAGAGLILSFWRQPGGLGNPPEFNDSLWVEFRNDRGQWITAAVWPGEHLPNPVFTNEVIAVDGVDPAGGTFFHGGFQFRFRSVGLHSLPEHPFDDWFIDDVFFGAPNANPTVSVTPSAITDTLLVNGSSRADITIANLTPQPSTLFFTLDENPAVDWLTADSSGGALASRRSVTIGLTLDATGLAAGTFTTDLVVSSNDSLNPAVTVPVTLVINDAPVVGFSPDSVILGPLAPGSADSATFQLINSGNGPLTFTLRDDDQGGPFRFAAPKAPRRYPAQWYEMDLAKGEADPRRGTPPAMDLGGPDGFGYVWKDSNEPGGPVFDWRDIRGAGTPLALGDDDFFLFPMPFSFSFYGQEQTQVRISSNGYLTFGSDGSDFSNDPIPSAQEPNALIAPLWEDFNPNSGGSIHLFADGDEMIVQYTDIPLFGGVAPNTFQVILKATGEIIYQYLDLQDDGGLGATVGIENGDGSDGLEVAFNNGYPVDGLAIRIATDAPWLDVSPAGGVVPANSSLAITVTGDATGLLGGRYRGQIAILSNDPLTPETAIPVSMEVTGTPGIAVSPDPLVFDDSLFVNANETRDLTISNTGNSTLSIAGVRTDNDAFIVDSSALRIPPFSAVDLAVTFAPDSAGAYSAVLTIDSDDPTAPMYMLSLTGGAVAAPQLVIDPDTLIVTVSDGDSAEVAIAIRNVAGPGAATLIWNADYTFSAPLAPRSGGNGGYPRGEAPLSIRPASAGDGIAAGRPMPSGPMVNAGGIAYGTDILSGVFFRTRLDLSDSAAVISNTSGQYYGGDFDGQGRFLAIDGQTNELVRIDTASGIATSLSAIDPGPGQVWTGITWSDHAGRLYGLSTGTINILYDVNADAGTATVLDTIDILSGTLLIDIAARPGTGMLYSLDIATDAIYVIDPADGVATMLGLAGFDANFAQGMDFDNRSGELYLAAFNNSSFLPELRSVDLNTGLTQFLGYFQTAGEVTAFGIPGSPGSPLFTILPPGEGRVAPGESGQLDVRVFGINPAQQGSDTTHFARLVVYANDPLKPATIIPVTVTVTNSPLAIGESAVLPERFELGSNYPNPFNPTTTVRYALPRADRVSISVYSILGQRVATLVDGRVEAGRHRVRWDGRNDAGRQVGSGVYLVRMQAESGFHFTRKVMLLK